jgi:hypothetical protein
MACDCNLCVRDKTAKEQLSLLSREQQLYWATIYNDLTHAEEDLIICQAERGPLPDIEDLARAAHKAHGESLGVEPEDRGSYEQLNKKSKFVYETIARAVLKKMGEKKECNQCAV